jgi:hypothetical protein
VDVFTNEKVGPQVLTLKADFDAIVQDVNTIPNTDGSGGDSSDLAVIITNVTRGLTIATIIWTGGSFIKNLRDFYVKKQGAVTPPEERQPLLDDLTSGLNKSVTETGTIADVSPKNEAPVPGVPDEQRTTTFEKIGTVFDVVFFILGIVGLVMNIVQYTKTQDALEKAIDQANDSLKKAEAQSTQIQEDEAKFFRDIPTTFLVIYAQLVQVVQIATASLLIKSSQPDAPTQAVLQGLIDNAKKYIPFTDAEITTMVNFSANLDKIQQDFPKPEDNGPLLDAAYKEFEKTISSQRLQDAFLQAGKAYDGLDTLLQYSVTNFNYTADFVKVITEVQSLLKSFPGPNGVSLALWQAILTPMLHRDPAKDPVSSDLVLSVIAVYTTFVGDTYYKDGDLKAIRAKYSLINKAEWDAWIASQSATTPPATPTPATPSSSSSASFAVSPSDPEAHHAVHHHVHHHGHHHHHAHHEIPQETPSYAK